MKMKENNTSNIQKSIWIELWDCIKNGKSRLDYPNFPFSTFNFKKLSLGHNMFFTLQTVYTKGERRLAVRADDIRSYSYARA